MRSITAAVGLLLSPVMIAALPAQAADRTSTGAWTIGIEALSWHFSDSPVPFPIITDGVLGAPGTQVLLGDAALSTGSHRGARLHLEHAFDARWGVEGRAFGLQTRHAGAGVASSGEIGSIDLMLPYIDAITGEESGVALSQSQIYRGSAQEQLRNRLRGADLDLRWSLTTSTPWRLDVLGGLRYLDFREDWTLTTESPYLPAFEPDVWQTTDRFDSRNRFYGAQLGLHAQWAAGRLVADTMLKVAVGTVRQSTRVQGTLLTNDFTSFGPTQTFVGGYFAQPSNIGRHSRSELSVVPEAALDLGYRITDTLTVKLGYSWMQFSHVLRPGNQVNRTLNPTQSTSFTETPDPVPSGPAMPDFRHRNSDLRVQGLQLRLDLSF